jgi:hypothetical protein
MQHHRSLTVLLTGSLILGLAGCAGDSLTSSAKAPLALLLAQAEKGKEQPPSGEVQERAQTTVEEQKRDKSGSDKVQERSVRKTVPIQPESSLPPSSLKTPTPSGPVPIPYPNEPVQK